MIKSLLSFDQSAFIFLNSINHPALNSLMLFLSGQAIWIPFVGYFVWYSYKYLFPKDRLLFILFLILTLIATDVTSSYVVKNLFARLRPCRELDLLPLIYNFGQKCGGRFGFVSSHAANSVALVWFFLRATNRQLSIWNLLWLAPLGVSFSRIYLGVHYPGDIIGGAVIGAAWAYFFSWSYRVSLRGNPI